MQGNWQKFRLNQTAYQQAAFPLYILALGKQSKPEPQKKTEQCNSASVYISEANINNFSRAFEERSSFKVIKSWHFSCLLHSNTCLKGMLFAKKVFFKKKRGTPGPFWSHHLQATLHAVHSPLIISLALFCFKPLCYHINQSFGQLLGPGSEILRGQGKAVELFMTSWQTTKSTAELPAGSVYTFF